MFKQILFFCIFVLLFSGCSLKDLHDLKLDLKITPNNKAIISGQIKENPKSNKPIYLVLFKLTGKDPFNKKDYSIVDFAVLNKPKEYQFTVNKGNYFLYACQNMTVLQKERYAYEFNSSGIVIEHSNQTVEIPVKMNPIPRIVEEKNILIGTTQQAPFFIQLANIKHATLDDNIFSRDNAKMGLWKPDDFYQKIGGGLYLLDEFDASKTPVIFVHGMNGTPRDFEAIIKGLDKTKYLPIVYYYASGSNLNYTVAGFRYSMDLLKEKYRIKKIVLVAHSMGGLVSRALINTLKEIKIDNFITLSTPWNGQKYAKLGEGIAKRLAESFGNMVPNSAFIMNNLNIPLALNTKHYLLFSYKGKSSVILDHSNDGVISLSSQLFPKVQRQAYYIYGVNETHTGILKTKETLSFINKILILD